jgi:hypothetical protein
VQLIVSDDSANLLQREVWRQDDEHNDADHKYSLQTSSAYGWDAIGKCFTVPHSYKDFLGNVERNQYDREHSGPEQDWVD